MAQATAEQSSGQTCGGSGGRGMLTAGQEGRAMEESESKRRERAPIAVVLIVVLLILPGVYVLSIGPIHWLHAHGYIDNATFGLIMKYVYKPVLYAARHSNSVAEYIMTGVIGGEVE